MRRRTSEAETLMRLETTVVSTRSHDVTRSRTSLFKSIEGSDRVKSEVLGIKILVNSYISLDLIPMLIIMRDSGHVG